MKYFGTDGIRGEAFVELKVETAFILGQALVEAFHANEIVIGYDTRQSSFIFANSIAKGIISQGGNVLFAKVVSTPMLSYYSKKNKIWGVMITASHNPYTDNGIKVFNSGLKTNEVEEKTLEEYLSDKSLKNKKRGSIKEINIFSEYKKIYNQFVKTDSKIAFDCANGSLYEVAPLLWNIFSNDNKGYFIKPDGTNINFQCGSTNPNILFEIVKEGKYDLGFSYDGDGDRLIVVDQNRIYEGDILIYAYAKYLHRKKLLKNNKIVLTIMSNPGIVKSLNKLGIDVIQTPIGDKHVISQLNNNHLSLGGENSGHIILNNLLNTGDGLLASVYLTQILADEKTTLFDYVKEAEIHPLKMINISGIDKSILLNNEVNDKINTIKTSMSNRLVIVRPSGTENLIRIVVSHEDEGVVTQTIKELEEIILKGGKLL